LIQGATTSTYLRNPFTERRHRPIAYTPMRQPPETEKAPQQGRSEAYETPQNAVLDPSETIRLVPSTQASAPGTTASTRSAKRRRRMLPVHADAAPAHHRLPQGGGPRNPRRPPPQAAAAPVGSSRTGSGCVRLPTTGPRPLLSLPYAAPFAAMRAHMGGPIERPAHPSPPQQRARPPVTNDAPLRADSLNFIAA
jgi:hypothetical protein